jgi:hypothetical protein
MQRGTQVSELLRLPRPDAVQQRIALDGRRAQAPCRYNAGLPRAFGAPAAGSVHASAPPASECGTVGPTIRTPRSFLSERARISGPVSVVAGGVVLRRTPWSEILLIESVHAESVLSRQRALRDRAYRKRARRDRAHRKCARRDRAYRKRSRRGRAYRKRARRDRARRKACTPRSCSVESVHAEIVLIERVHAETEIMDGVHVESVLVDSRHAETPHRFGGRGCC